MAPRNKIKINVIPMVLGIVFASIMVTWIYTASQFRAILESPTNDQYILPKGLLLPKTASVSASFRVPILLYHYVEYVKDKGDTIRQSLDIIPKIFDEQIKTLTEAGYTFITASELADALDGKSQLPPKPILITLDDGHWDLYTDVLPILEKYHVKVTAYVISGVIGNNDFMTDDQFKKVIASGLVEIGAHTVHHVGLAKRLFPLVQYEVAESKKMLENTYHIPVVTFAYPGGSFDAQAATIVKNAGFRVALSTIPGIAQTQENRYYLYRLRPGARTGESLLQFLQQSSFKSW